MVLAQKQKYRPMEQDRKPEINLELWALYLTKKAKTYNGAKIVSSISSAGKTEKLYLKKKKKKRKEKKLENFLTIFTVINSQKSYK